MANKRMKRYSTKLVIRETEIKTTMKYHCIPNRTAEIKQTGNTKCEPRRRATGIFIHYWQECHVGKHPVHPLVSR